MIESNSINTVCLTELYRQAEESNIINLAYQVNEDNLDYEVFTNKEDLIFYNLDNNMIMNNNIKTLLILFIYSSSFTTIFNTI